MANAPAALGAKRLLSTAARKLGTADPVAQLAPFIDESLQLPPGSRAYQRPHAFETRFSERSPRNLHLGMAVGDPEGPGSERTNGTTRAMRYVVHQNFGSDALRWLDGRAEPLQYGSDDAWFGSGFDHNGVREASVSYAWGPHTSESLARSIHESVELAMATMPSLRPAMTTIHCGRSFGSQAIIFQVDGALRLSDLRPLMDVFELSAQHTRLVNAIAFVLGARFTLPPNTVLVTLRPTASGMEMQLDVDLEGIPDVPPNVASLLQLQLVERPQSLSALERWMSAMTPEGYLSPGALSVLSVLIRPNMGPRLSIDMRPSVVAGGDSGPQQTAAQPAPPMPPSDGSATPPDAAGVLGLATGGGLFVSGDRSPWEPIR